MPGRKKTEPQSDPVWKKRSRGLLQFLQKARTWDEMEVWAAEHGLTQSVLRNTIAYCHRLISHSDGKWEALVDVPRSEE
jgi:hypothetical protein